MFNSPITIAFVGGMNTKPNEIILVQIVDIDFGITWLSLKRDLHAYVII